MHYQSTFLTSTTNYARIPVIGKPCYALIGRSNVGKSSLINMLLARRNLARTSSIPGKTTTINYFLVNDSWCLVDLPGFGWAKQSKVKRNQWHQMMQNYLTANPNLRYIFLLIDARHPPLANDQAFLTWLLAHKLPCALIFTKIDKNKRTAAKHQQIYAHYLTLQRKPIPMFATSSKTKQGGEALLQCIEADSTAFHAAD